MKNNLFLGAILGLAISGVANATLIDFDTNGSSSGGKISNISAFDWLPGSSYTEGAGTNTNNGEILSSYVHGSLGSFIGENGTAIQNDFGLGTNYEITFVAGFDEIIYGTSGGINPITGNYERNLNFASIDSQLNFFQVWIDYNPNSNALAGTGYNDGIMIASGTILAGGSGTVSSTFAYSGDILNPVSTDPNDYVIFDQFGSDNWGGTKSNAGIGGSLFNTEAQVNEIDTNYFKSVFSMMNFQFNSSQKVPFQETDPSKSFVKEDGTQIIPNIGAINGITGDGVILQVDGNNSFITETEVPVPNPLLLMLSGIPLIFGTRLFSS